MANWQVVESGSTGETVRHLEERRHRAGAARERRHRHAVHLHDERDVLSADRLVDLGRRVPAGPPGRPHLGIGPPGSGPETHDKL